MTEFTRSVLIVAGGTGGHIYPALAVADCLRDHDVQTVWLGSNRGLETRLVPRNGYRLITIAVSGLRGSGFIRWLLAPLALTVALAQALFTMARIRPHLVLGMGGFASGPGGVAAWLCRRPLVIHEQNAIPGFTNSVLSRIATRIFQGFPNSFPKAVGAVTVGNPVRQSIIAVPGPEERDIVASPFNILVVGGSRGAQSLNIALPEAFSRLSSVDVEIWHQAGDGNSTATRARYGSETDRVRVADFIEDMATAYRWASIVVCRAGALTVCELATAGAAAILVPFPYAVDDHQTANAAYLVDAKAASLVPEGAEFTARLTRELQRLSDHRDELLAMACRARKLAMTDAAAQVASYCLEQING